LDVSKVSGEEMITVHLMGGCGNQLFMFATAQAAALRLGTGMRLYTAGFDTDWRVYSLGLFRGITAPTCRDYAGPVLCESGMPYNPQLVASIKDPCTLYGYFQTEKYFSETENLLREQLQPKQPLVPFARDIERQIRAEGSKSAFLTIRRTDYVNTAYHGVLSMDYNRKAAELVANRVTDPCFFVFSDEPEWVQENFQLPYRFVVAGNFDRSVKPHLGREDSELYLMSLCRHAVMANSSYSWWGAWLNPKRDRVVVAPKQWFQEAANDTRDIVPERWIVL
jgi:hypothetical protein